jgi:hypothetical protein
MFFNSLGAVQIAILGRIRPQKASANTKCHAFGRPIARPERPGPLYVPGASSRLAARTRLTAIRLRCLSENSSRICSGSVKNHRHDERRITGKRKSGLDGGEDSILVAAISAPRRNSYDGECASLLGRHLSILSCPGLTPKSAIADLGIERATRASPSCVTSTLTSVVRHGLPGRQTCAACLKLAASPAMTSKERKF